MADKKVTVVKGDTLSAIAKANNTTVAKIAAANPQISNVNKINVGQKVVIPAATPAKTSTPAAPKSDVNASQDALRKLTSGSTLTDAERRLLGMGPAVTPTLVGGTKIGGSADKPISNDGKILGTEDADVGQGEDPNTTVTLIRTIDNGDGTFTNVYSDGTTTVTGTKRDSGNDALLQQLLAEQRAAAAANAAAAQAAAAKAALEKQQARENIITVMRARFKQYGLETLAAKIEQLAVDGASEATITLQLQETPEYQTRFKANAARLKNNLQVLTPAEYLTTEDTYRQVLRSYGLKQFDTDEYVSQFLANDVSPTELTTRVQTAVQRVQNADPAVSKTLRDYYGIGQADLVAYVLDPATQFEKVKRQVTAAEIGTAARIQGLETGVGVAEQLAAQGVTQAEAQKGYATIADILPTAEKLSAIYGTTLEGYGQSSAEQEVFNSLASAQRARQKLTAREIAQFSGAAGTSKASLTSQKSGQI